MRHCRLRSWFRLEDRATPAVTRVTDIASGTAGSDPGPFAVVGSKTYFVATDASNTTGLYVTDGTEAGTVLLRGNLINIGDITALGESVFFAADGNDGSTGTELWVTSGTPQSTKLFADVAPGLGDKNAPNSSFPAELTVLGPNLYFAATVANDREIYRTNGVDAPSLAVNAWTGGSSDPTELTAYNGLLYFAANRDKGQRDLLAFDGFNAQAVTLPESVSGPDPRRLAVSGSLLYATALTGGGRELYVLNTENKATRLALTSDALDKDPNSLTDVDGTLFFTVRTDNTAKGNPVLWRTAGTQAGTLPVLTGANKTVADPQQLASAGGTLYFSAEDGIIGRELWRTDPLGTVASIVANIYSGQAPGGGDLSSEPSGFVTLGDSVVFTAVTKLGRELWKTDGTSAGTQLVRDVFPGAASGFGLDLAAAPLRIATAGNRVTFAADDGSTGRELWTSDATSSGTSRVRDINVEGASSDPDQFTRLAAKTTLFFAETSETGSELYRTDGVSGGTLVRDVRPGQRDGVPRTVVGEPNRPTLYNGLAYFAANDGSSGVELWRSDGTSSGTVLVADIYPGGPATQPNESFPGGLTVFGTKLYFAATNAGVRELWVYDGAAPPRRASDPAVFNTATGADPRDITLFGGLFFYTAVFNGNRQLVQVDGTTAKVIAVGAAADPDPLELTVSGNLLFLTVNDGGTGRQLWRITQAAETQQVVAKTGAFTEPNQLTDVNGVVFFSARGATGDFELWRTVGNQENTLPVPGPNGATVPQPHALAAAGGVLYFSSDDGINGRELYRTDAAGTKASFVTDIFPGSSGGQNNSGDPAEFITLGTNVYFVATNSAGRELWRTNGSDTGTFLVRDIFPGPRPSGAANDPAPGEFAVIDGALQFAATDPVFGREVYREDGKLEAKVTLSASASIAEFGTPVTVTITVTSADGSTTISPTGTVDLFENGGKINLPLQLTEGKVQYQSAALSVGPHVFTANYSGDGTFSPAVSSEGVTVTITDPVVASKTTTTGLQVTPGTLVVGGTATFTVTVNSETGPVPAGGTVTITGGPVSPLSFPFKGSPLTDTIAFNQAGTFSLKATYSGAGEYKSSASTAQTVTVNSAAAENTVTTITANPTKTNAGNAVVLTAKVVVPPDTPVGVGTVTFNYAGNKTIGQAVVDGTGTATISTTILPTGVNQVVAIYSGVTGLFNPSFTAVPAEVEIITPDKTATATTLAVSATTIVFGQTLTLTAAVAPNPGVVAGTRGSVQFFDDTVSLGSSAIDANGTASLAVTTLPLGKRSLTAKFLGNDQFAESPLSTPPDVVEVTPVPTAPTQYIVVGADAGGGPNVRVFQPGGTTPLFDFFAYSDKFTGGVRVASADFNGDGIEDIVTGTGPGGGPHVRVFSGAANGTAVPTQLFEFFAYDLEFRGGIFLSTGDVTGDGVPDFVVGADAGGGPNIRVFNGKTSTFVDGKPVRVFDYFAYDAKFTGGVRVGGGDYDGDGFADMVVGAGPGGGPNVRVFSGQPSGTTAAQPAILADFFAYDAKFTGGVFVAAGDFTGDGKADLAVAPDRGGEPVVKLYNGGDRALLTEFAAYDRRFLGGVRVAITDATGDGTLDIFTGPGPGGGPDVQAFKGLPDYSSVRRFNALPEGFLGGIWVG